MGLQNSEDDKMVFVMGGENPWRRKQQSTPVFLIGKSFLSDQCKEIEENNRMGKTSDLFKKIRDTKGTFHAKTSTIKDRNGMDGPKRNRRY